MALHLIKLCVGCESVEDLEAWIATRVQSRRARGEGGDHAHVTRMAPKRADELLDGGSLYWIIKGGVQCRQGLTGVVPFVDAEGVSRCRLELDPRVVRTNWQPRRPFQGWRYLDPREAPGDLDAGTGIAEMPQALRRELADLGLL